MSSRTAVAMVALFLMAAPSAGAQSLADGTRPIGSEPTESKGLVIDNSSLSKASRSSRPTTDGNWVLESAEECVESVKEINIVLTETASGPVFFDSDWRRRFTDSAIRFRLAQSDLSMNEPDPRYIRSLDRLQEGVDAAELSVAAVLAAIEINQPLYSTPKKDLIQAQRMMETAFAELRADHRAEQAAEPAPPIDPIAADRSINTLCGQRFGSGSDNYSSCVSSQKAAINLIMVRSAPGLNVEVATFNTIRNHCRFDYPNDYVGRNRCEEQRMAAKAGR